jgi:hypothetical protein
MNTRGGHRPAARRARTPRDDIAAAATHERHQDDSTASVRSESRQAQRYLGAANSSGCNVWTERNGIRGSLRYCGEDHLVPYAWGRPGIGARELARALLFDATGSPALAERFCRDLTHEVIARLPAPEFALERDDILAWLADRP